jgi:simple sugar transport system ATP-binding protein
VRHLSIENVTLFSSSLSDINLQVCSGEIVGVAGISGNGQKELLDAVTGETLTSQNESIELLGESVGCRGAAARRALGLAHVPEERLGRGAVPSMSLARNALLTAAQTGLLGFGFIRELRTREFARSVIERFGVRCRGELALASSLSGGNLQKFIVGREVLLAPKVLVVAQPTWGVDVAASQRIRQALLDLRETGVAILVVSEDLDELLEISDRLHVLAQGRLSRSLARNEVSVALIGHWMSGDFDYRDDIPSLDRMMGGTNVAA